MPRASTRAGPSRPPTSSVSASEVGADVAIVGGGAVGLTLAIALAEAGLEAIVIDREDPVAAASPERDGRTMAIAQGPQRMLEALGVWRTLSRVAEPIIDIRVSDGPSRLFLHYDHRDVGTEPLGYIVENGALRETLLACARSYSGVRLFVPATLSTVEWTAGEARLDLADGRRVRAPLLVAADGRRSEVRRRAGIDVVGWRYRQVAIVCTIEHERPHRGVAHERFLSAGPFAILPMVGNRSSIVWTEREDHAGATLALPDDAFHDELARRVGSFLGEIRLVGGRFSYPLSWHHARRYVGPRLALAGDAAHGMHPIAGQGLNMGLRDVAALAEVVVEARRLGLDVGAVDVLERYQRWRRFDNLTMLVVTDALNRLFSNDAAPVRLARDLGLAAVNRVPLLKRLFMRDAMGVLGVLPGLLRGVRP